MFLGSPRCFVIVKNLKRNRQDKNLILAHKGIFHSVALEAVASEWAPGCLHLYVCTSNPVTPPGVAGGPEVVFRAMGTWPLTPGRPPAPSMGLKFGRIRRWWWLRGLSLKADKPAFYLCQLCDLGQVA